MIGMLFHANPEHRLYQAVHAQQVLLRLAFEQRVGEQHTDSLIERQWII